VLHRDGKIYDEEKVDQIAIYIGKLANELEIDHDEDTYKRHYRTEAMDIFDIVWATPDWLERARDSEFYKYTEAYRRDCEYQEKLKWLEELEDEE